MKELEQKKNNGLNKMQNNTELIKLKLLKYVVVGNINTMIRVIVRNNVL